MTKQDVSNLGKVLTVLSLEDKFLSNGELSNFKLVERGSIAKGIIEEKLRLGKWQGVVQMIYGGFGKADALYEGDRNKLRNDIIKSATEHPKSLDFRRGEVFNCLEKAGENDLLFKLATNIFNLNYEDFNLAVGKINRSYFDDVGKGAQRKHVWHQTAADKAMNEENYYSAFHHFSEIGDNAGVDRIFETTLNKSSGDLLEKIALSDPAQKDERLKRMVLSSISETEGGLNPLAAFELYKKYNVSLSAEEKSTLQERVAESTDSWDVDRKLSRNPEERLLWAKKHARDEPKTAYKIFTEQEFNGAPVIKAVKAGLSLKSYQNEEKTLGTSEISESHLRKAYKTASFDVKVQIASHLKDSDKLQELSGQAHKRKDLDKAYRLWIAGKGNLDGDYIDGVRTGLIENAVETRYGSMHFLDSSDTKGMIEAYTTLMETDKGKRRNNLSEAYEIALNLGDEDRTQRVREEIVAISPESAICDFTNKTRGNDEKGLDYVVRVVASEHGVDSGELRRFVEKYQTV